jgi:hypothetical protein
MKTLRRILSSVALLVAPFTAEAACWSPHIGAEYKYWGVTARDYAYPIFPRLNNAANLYIGTRINGFFGVDIGYEDSENKHKTHVFEGIERPFIEIEREGDSTMIDLRLHAFHGDLNFYWEVVEAFELIFMMGIANIYPKTHINRLTDGTWYEFKNKSDPFWVGRFGFAAQYNPIPCFGIKASVTFDAIQRLRYRGFDQYENIYDLNPYNKATSFGLGFVYSLSNPRRQPCSFIFTDD